MMTRSRSDLMRLLLVMKIIIAQAQLFDAEHSQRHLQSLRQKGSDRGGSFGLENFLAQPFDDDNFEKHVADMEEQEIRKEPRKEPRKPSRSGLPTLGLESMTPLQDFDRHLNTPHRKSEKEDHRRPNHREYDDPTLPPFRPINSRSEIVTERQMIKFDEGDFPSYRQSPGKNKIRTKYEDEGERFNDGNLRKPLERPNTFRKNIAGEEVNDPDATTGRPKKRITMRRRRKRPQGLATSEDSPTAAHEPTQETISEPISRVSTTHDYKTTTEAPLEFETEQTVSKRKRPMGFRRTNKNNQADQNPKDNVVAEESNEKPVIDQKEKDEEIEVRTTTVAPTKKSEMKPYKPKIDRTEPFLASTETLSVNRLKEETPTPEEDKSADRLKSFLKQHSKGSVSLSELLQTQNLSLTDFLKGKKAEAEKAAAEAAEKNRLKSRHDTTAAASISVKSRPFSKNDNTVRSRPWKNVVKNEEVENREEETENYEKPTYNGFKPKNPRRKGAQEDPEPEDKIKPVPTPSVVESVSELNTDRVSSVLPTSETKITSPEPKPETKRIRDHQSLISGLHQQNYRRKLKIPSKTTESTTTTEVTTPSTSASTTTTTTTTTAATTAESTTTTEGYRRKKIPGLKIPFKSTNNPDLSLIIPNKRTRNYFNERIQSTRIPLSEKEELDITPEIKPKPNDEVNALPVPTKQEKSPVFKLNESLFNFDKSQEAEVHEDTQKPKKVEPYNPPPNRSQEEPRQSDEILELLKSAATAQRLEKILAARNMTIGELLLNREKGSAQTNFSNLFTENKTSHYPVPTDIALEDSLFSATSIEEKTEEINKKSRKKEKPFIDDFETGETSINNRVVVNPEDEYEKRESRKINKNVMKFNNFGEGMEYAHGFVRNKKQNDDNIFLNNEKSPADGVYFFVPSTRDTIPPTQIYTNSKDDIYRESKFNRNEYYENENNFLEELQRNTAANNLRRKNMASELPEEKQTETKDSEIDKSFIPPVVKSTIIISGVVMGIALFVFIAIFAACGWKQRQLRLKASSSILNDTLTKADLKKKVKNSTALTPISIKHSSTYKKTLDFDDTLSVSSEASSYLWNTLKNTFTSRNNTLKNRLEKEQQGMKSRTNTINKKDTNTQRTINAKEEAKKYEERLNSLHRENEKPSSSKKIYADREFIKTSNSFRRGTNVNNSHYRFDNWSHGQ